LRAVIVKQRLIPGIDDQARQRALPLRGAPAAVLIPSAAVFQSRQHGSDNGFRPDGIHGREHGGM